MSFLYFWGSEQYGEYIDSAFNDVFGFYLNDYNIALVPDSDTYAYLVSINNVNYYKNADQFHWNDLVAG